MNARAEHWGLIGFSNRMLEMRKAAQKDGRFHSSKDTDQALPVALSTETLMLGPKGYGT